MIDQAAGEIATLPFHPRALQGAADGLFAALTAWRSVANHLELVPDAVLEAARVRDCLPPPLASPEAIGDRERWQGDPRATRTAMLAAARRLVTLNAETPSLRLLCDRTAEGLLALSRAIDGVLVLSDPWAAKVPRRVGRLRVPDILPALVNGVRAFLTIGAASLVWIWTAWPGGTGFITFAAVAIILFAPQQDAAFAMARSFTIGTALTAVCAAVVAFALLPQQSSFAGLSALLALVLIPAGALSSQAWQQPLFVALEANFVPLLGPSNPPIVRSAAVLQLRARAAEWRRLRHAGDAVATSDTAGGAGIATAGVGPARPAPPHARPAANILGCMGGADLRATLRGP